MKTKKMWDKPVKEEKPVDDQISTQEADAGPGSNPTGTTPPPPGQS